MEVHIPSDYMNLKKQTEGPEPRWSERSDQNEVSRRVYLSVYVLQLP